MSRDEQRVADYLGHIVEAIDRVRMYVEGMTESAFLSSSLVQDAVIRNLEVIGEASHNIERTCPKFTADHPQLPLSFAYQMRNAVAHGYFKVDLEIVWNTIQRDLPGLRSQVEEALKNLPRSGDAGNGRTKP